MTLDRLWADWRSAYVSSADEERDKTGCVICNLVGATDDAEALVLERTPETITVMNLFPYGSGHLMVAPVQHAAAFDDLTLSCKKIQDDKGKWEPFERYVRTHSEAKISHKICPDCASAISV